MPTVSMPSCDGAPAAGAQPVSPVSLTLDSITADPTVKAAARKAAREFFGSRIPGKTAAPAVRKLLTLRWHTKLSTATRAAEAANKPILWVQALGDLEGYT